jgi:thymidine kinase
MNDLGSICSVLAFGAWLCWGLYMLYKNLKRPQKFFSILDENLQLVPALRASSQSGNSVGSLHCIVGPMFSGKTSAMVSQVVRYADVTKSSPPLIINHIVDKSRVVGNGNTKIGISSHSSQMKGLSDRVKTIYAEKLADVDVSEYNVVGIDESQFYDDLYETILKWLSQGKHIYCAGLDGSFLGASFGEIHKLLPISDTFTKVSAVCYLCQKENALSGRVITPDSFVAAPFTAKIGGNMTLEIESGGQDKYIPVCRYHFITNKQNVK